MKKVLTIAGSDSSGGAGIQADLKTMLANGVYGMSVITVLTAQNTMGVLGVSEVAPEFIGQQIDAVFKDIPPDAVKIGMLYSASVMEMVALKLKEYQAKNIVLDPVMVASSGSELIKSKSRKVLVEKLLGIADLVTPNLSEAQVLSGIKISAKNEMVQAGRIIQEKAAGKAVLIKGGHLKDSADDLLLLKNEEIWIWGERIKNSNTHGTGCTLSSAISCFLARGYEMVEAVKMGKAYLTAILQADLDLGQGSGPLDHGCLLE